MRWFLALYALLLVGTAWFLLARGKVFSGWRLKAVPRARRYHCVSIRHGASACDATRRLEGRRFLPTEAPSLPLAGCDAERCRCRYMHHDDRRTGDERRSPVRSLHFEGADRRITWDRRSASGSAR